LSKWCRPITVGALRWGDGLDGAATHVTCGINVLVKLRDVAELGCPAKENARNASRRVPRLDPDYPVRAFCVRILLGLS
jgi:hypothetical protein